MNVAEAYDTTIEGTIGRDYNLSFRCNSIHIKINGRQLLANLIIMPLERLYVILGVD